MTTGATDSNDPARSRQRERRMADLPEEFEKAQAEAKNLPEKPDSITLLKLYALYKQATSGDAEGSRPGFSDMVGRAKWDAWQALSGTEKEDAMQQYIEMIAELKD